MLEGSSIWWLCSRDPCGPLPIWNVAPKQEPFGFWAADAAAWLDSALALAVLLVSADLLRFPAAPPPAADVVVDEAGGGSICGICCICPADKLLLPLLTSSWLVTGRPRRGACCCCCGLLTSRAMSCCMPPASSKKCASEGSLSSSVRDGILGILCGAPVAVACSAGYEYGAPCRSMAELVAA